MKEEMEFSIEKMGETAYDLNKMINDIDSVLRGIDASVIRLGQVWVSDETGTYETFKSNYDIKKKELDKAYNDMNSFRRKLTEKEGDFSDAVNKIVTSINNNV